MAPIPAAPACRRCWPPGVSAQGGFLWVDDFWGPWAWEAFIGEISKALPPGEFPVKDLTAEHPIYRMLFPFTHVPQVPSMQFWRQTGGATSEMDEYSATAHIAAIADKQGRVMVLMSTTPTRRFVEREGDEELFFNFRQTATPSASTPCSIR
jgi:hypothetical protein